MDLTRKYLAGRWPLWLLVLLQAAVILPFHYTTEFGERDSYRMFLGAFDSIRSGAWFDSSLLYNREASFGYYGFLYLLAPLFGRTPTALIELMNWLSVVSVVLFMIPFYLVIERLTDTTAAIASGLVLIATPVWWHCGVYGHPVTMALLFFFCGLALVGACDVAPSIIVQFSAVMLFSAALTFRFDATLLYLALAGVLWQARKTHPIRWMREGAIYVLIPLLLFEVLKHLLPAVTHGAAPPSVTGLLTRFERTTNLHNSLRNFTIGITEGFTPILLLCCPIAIWLLLKRKQIPLLLFVFAEVAANLVFFLLDPLPPRHFILMVPAMSLSGALVAMEALAAFQGKTTRYAGAMAGLATALLVAALSLALNGGPGFLSYLHSEYLDLSIINKQVAAANKIAADLVGLPSLGSPVVVLCDSNLVIAEMEKRAPGTTAIFNFMRDGNLVVGYHQVREGGNRFVMVEESWEEGNVKAFDKSGRFPDLPLLSAPFLTIPYTGTRRRLTVGSQAAARGNADYLISSTLPVM